MTTTRILIIDDDDLVRATLSRILIAESYVVIEAMDGNEGIKKYQDGEIDLVITDILMPEKEGIETIKELRNSGGKAKIIAISGGDRSGSKMYLRMAEKLGADGILAKPIRRQELLAKIEEVLKA